MQRPKGAPSYKFTREQLSTTKMWTWYMQPGHFEHLDEDRLQMGLTSMTAWVTQMLNHSRSRGARSRREGELRTRRRADLER